MAASDNKDPSSGTVDGKGSAMNKLGPYRLATVAVASASVVTVLFLAGCSGTSSDTDPSASSTTSTTSAVDSSDAASADANDADRMFATMMVQHHQQAIDMSNTLLAKEDVDPAVAELAQRIVEEQGREIGRMDTWLDAWAASGPSSTTPTATETGMPDTETDMSETEMPEAGMSDSDTSATGSGAPATDTDMVEMGHDDGMMSREDMDALAAADGPTGSTLFLQQMIKHHEGAIAMAQTEVDNGEYPDAVALARQIIDSQTAEVQQMRDMLAGP